LSSPQRDSTLFSATEKERHSPTQIYSKHPRPLRRYTSLHALHVKTKPSSSDSLNYLRASLNLAASFNYAVTRRQIKSLFDRQIEHLCVHGDLCERKNKRWNHCVVTLEATPSASTFIFLRALHHRHRTFIQ